MDSKSEKIRTWSQLPKPSRLLLARKRERDRKKPTKDTFLLRDLLSKLSVKNLRVIARNHDLVLGIQTKDLIIEKIRHHLLDEIVLSSLVKALSPKEKKLFLSIIEAQGIRDYNDVVNRFGPENMDSPYWFLMQPHSTLGKLRAKGLLYVGEVFSASWLQVVVCIPQDLLPKVVRLMRED